MKKHDPNGFGKPANFGAKLKLFVEVKPNRVWFGGLAKKVFDVCGTRFLKVFLLGEDFLLEGIVLEAVQLKKQNNSLVKKCGSNTLNTCWAKFKTLKVGFITLYYTLATIREKQMPFLSTVSCVFVFTDAAECLKKRNNMTIEKQTFEDVFPIR